MATGHCEAAESSPDVTEILQEEDRENVMKGKNCPYTSMMVTPPEQSAGGKYTDRKVDTVLSVTWVPFY